ncbi:MAG: hypothetical protein HFJ44_04325 [Clostridia bacterium]|nr:hypothetical protein [Clostridia bacterium]
MGTALVKEGDVVEAGQKLIGGWMEGKYTGVRYMHAQRRSRSKSLVLPRKRRKFNTRRKSCNK